MSMSQPQSQFTVKKLYQGVIDDVIAGVRESFLDEGIDEQVLQELRMLWESKMQSTKAIDHGNTDLVNNGTQSTSASSKGARQSAAAASSATAASSAAAGPGPGPSPFTGASTPVIRADSNALVPIQITIPRHINDPPGVQKNITINVPASCIHNNKLQEILSLPDVQAVLALPLEQAAAELQLFVNNAAREPDQPYALPGYVPRTQSVISHPGQGGSGQNQRSLNALNGILQSDGHGVSADTSDEDEDDEDDEDDIDELDDDKDDLDEKEEEDAGQDEEPLNSGDDVSDAEENNDKLYNVEHVVVCQYDKITRTRNKWKFHLKDGIMNLNGKDYVFQKANGDAEW